MLFPSFFNAGKPTYEIEQSLRFNQADGHYLNRTPSTDGNRRTFTYSGWHKFLGMPDATNNRRIFGAKSANTDSGWFSFHMRPDGDNRLEIQLWNHSVIVDSRLRDFSAWYHLVLAVDTTQATATDRVKVYINGTQATYTNNSGSGISGFSQNLDLAVNDNAADHNIGTFESSTVSTSIMPMYAAEIYFVDGTALDQYDFGEEDDNGVWRPINVSGLTYGTNGFYLDFSNSSDLGEDQAGSNDWTANNFTTSGTGTDVMSDTPTNNFATLNPVDSSTNGVIAAWREGNLEVEHRSSSGNYSLAVSTIAFDSDDSDGFYFESTATDYVSSSYQSVCLIDAEKTVQEFIGNAPVGGSTGSTFGIGWESSSGYLRNFGSTITGWGPTTTTWTTDGDILMVFVKNNKVYLGKNGTWLQSADPSTESNPAITLSSAYKLKPGTAGRYSAKQSFNFGQRAFSYTPPTGAKTLCTANLAAPTVKDGSENFNTVLYTGDNTNNRTITGVGFQPDFVWVKNRSDTDGWPHILTDAVRGGGPSLQSNSTGAEVAANSSGYVSAFATDGFVVTEGDTRFANTNGSSATYVSWNWLAGGSGSSNTDGSITSTVSANASAGFSIVSWTASGTNNDTVGHGLGVVPDFMILKSRDGARDWLAYTQKIDGSLDFLRLNTTAAKADSSANVPTSTTFSVYGTDVNTSGEDIIAYCFAEVEGYSKFGSYTGNGSSDGPFVYCGFRPAWVMIKRTDSANDWPIVDSVRDTYNAAYRDLYANDSVAEYSGASRPYDLLSNGFKLRENVGRANTSGGTYIFAAFSEHPFGGSGVSPATAR